jgi:hypothetical protein
MSSTDPRRCPHDVTEPVMIDVLSGSEVIARVCVACLTDLPAAWGCTRCEWIEERMLCDPQPQKLLARPCQKHA